MKIKAVFTRSIMLAFALVSFIGCNLAYADTAANKVAKEKTTAQVALSGQTGKININTADARTLASTLRGIGLKKAQAIVTYRKTYGHFAHIDELKDVKGIGASILSKNAHLISIN
ncbi:MAG: competence protein ComEA [Proteobacteria bacterium]|nr:MAG: competence protein ComEA [Pseudomonadota bacterium]PIE39871.1 MAG: competence protein ComEA [Gammaproteobacteria bacterium]